MTLHLLWMLGILCGLCVPGWAETDCRLAIGRRVSHFLKPAVRPLLLCCVLLLPLLALADAVVTHAQADLDGDHTEEKISVDVARDFSRFTLCIGNRQVAARLDRDLNTKCDSLCIVDIDTHDRYQEVRVTTTDIDGTTSWLYWYNGKAIQRIGQYAKTVEIPGTGIVYEKWWTGFWVRTEKYVLDAKSHALTLVRQPFYYVGVDATVVKSLPMYEAKSKKTIIAHLLPRSTVTILLNSDDWYLLKTSTGLTGWIPESGIATFDGIPWAEGL